MLDIVHVRIDQRLIHGQVATTWIKKVGANRVIIVHDDYAKDPFMCQLNTMSAPAGVEVQTVETASVAARAVSEEPEGAKDFILFQTVPHALQAFRAGLKFSELQVGNISGGPGKVPVYYNINMDGQDARMLKELQDSGVRVYFQSIPEHAQAELDDVVAKAVNAKGSKKLVL